MFSTLSSFLPPALQLTGSQEKDLRPSPPQPFTEDISSPLPHSPPPQTVPEESATKKRKERTHESFIVVRPPPSKSNHPLNLQVQLVPPTGRQPTIVRRSESRDSDFGSLPDSAPSGDTSLSRTSSARSDISAYSSVTSLSTVSSSASSTGSARRMIIPLYNLQAHNVMTNVIVDAGTDAKIAKFQKRGLEVIGLAVVEPVEVVGGTRYEDVSGPAYNPGLLSAEPQGTGQGRTPTPTSSRLSLNSGDTHESAAVASSPLPGLMQTPPSPSPAVASSDRSGARRLLGKVFRRKDNQSQASPTMPGSPLPAVDPPSQGRPSKQSSLLLSQPLTHPPHGHTEPPTQTPTMSTVLGIQPTLRAPSPSHVVSGGRDVHKSVRPTSYVWVVRKWLKESPTAPEGVDVLSLVEIRLDWTRASSHSSGRRGSRSRRQQAGSSAGGRRNSVISFNSPSTSSLTGAGSRRPASAYGAPQSHSVSPAMPRGSLERSPSPRHSIRTSTNSTESDHSPPLQGIGAITREQALSDADDGEESDPEDSETPWTCHLVVRRLVRIPPGEDQSSPSSLTGDVRVKVGAIVPAPHHPKVVALFKIPFPLPDVYLHVRAASASRAPYPQYTFVEIESRRRVVTPAGVARPAPVPGGGIAYTTDLPKTPTQANAVGKLAQNAGFFISSQGRALKSRASAVGQNSNGSGSVGAHSGVPENGHGDALLVSGMLLSAEEIKDVVCCTALWVVVREAFGGVGRVNRKGDGWRIRG